MSAAPRRRYAVATWLFDLGPSGATQRLHTLLAALPDLLAPDEEVLVLHGREPPPPGLRAVPVPIPAAPSWRRALSEQLRLPRLLRALGASLLHLESLPVRRHLPCPVVLTIHDLRDLGPFRRRRGQRFVRSLRASARRATALIVPSEFTAGELTRVAPHGDVTVVPGAIPWPPPLPAARARDAFVHVGHLEPRKNLDLLLRAYAAAAARAPLPPLLLAGRDAGAGPALRALANTLGLHERVQFLGAVDAAALEQLYARAVAVLVPSRYEGFGMPALEALARGLPTVVSDAGALPELVGDAGIVLPVDAVDAWSTRLLAAPVCAAERARARAAQFAAPTVAARLLALWRRSTA